VHDARKLPGMALIKIVKYTADLILEYPRFTFVVEAHENLVYTDLSLSLSRDSLEILRLLVCMPVGILLEGIDEENPEFDPFEN
jgi:hypothetical protein